MERPCILFDCLRRICVRICVARGNRQLTEILAPAHFEARRYQLPALRGTRHSRVLNYCGVAAGRIWAGLALILAVSAVAALSVTPMLLWSDQVRPWAKRLQGAFQIAGATFARAALIDTARIVWRACRSRPHRAAAQTPAEHSTAAIPCHTAAAGSHPKPRIAIQSFRTDKLPTTSRSGRTCTNDSRASARAMLAGRGGESSTVLRNVNRASIRFLPSAAHADA